MKHVVCVNETGAIFADTCSDYKKLLSLRIQTTQLLWLAETTTRQCVSALHQRRYFSLENRYFRFSCKVFAHSFRAFAASDSGRLRLGFFSFWDCRSSLSLGLVLGTVSILLFFPFFCLNLLTAHSHLYCPCILLYSLNPNSRPLSQH